MSLVVWLFLATLMAPSGTPSQSEGWQGIVPLQSTRVDVERLLGSSAAECRCTYRLGDDNVFIQYSGKPCKGKNEGWNVPYDTVINISVYPRVKPRFSELQIDSSKYTKVADKEIKGAFDYVNELDGMTISVDGDSVTGFYYTPSKRDEYRRCPIKGKTTKSQKRSAS